jgi:hypothetical protein
MADRTRQSLIPWSSNGNSLKVERGHIVELEGREGGPGGDDGLLLYQIQVTGGGRRTRERQVDNGLLLYQFKVRSPVSTKAEKLTGDDEEVFTGAVQMKS